MSGHDFTLRLAREGPELAITLVEESINGYESKDMTVVSQHDEFSEEFRSKICGLSSIGILAKVGSSHGGHRAYYRMDDPDGLGGF